VTYIYLVQPGHWVYIAVGGTNIHIVHYFDHGYLEEIKMLILSDININLIKPDFLWNKYKPHKNLCHMFKLVTFHHFIHQLIV
jgi:hypothetical protein